MRSIELANGKGVALVDDHHYTFLSQFRWFLHPKGYAHTNWRRHDGSRAKVTMHRLIMGEPPFEGAQVDHINGDKLDNRSANLRWATSSQNRVNSSPQKNNSSGYKGVTWHKQRGRWQAAIKVDGRPKHIGLYATPEEAARAYDRAALELFGDRAKLNFPVPI